jgi:hypothetical protein
MKRFKVKHSRWLLKNDDIEYRFRATKVLAEKILFNIYVNFALIEIEKLNTDNQ